MKGFSILRVLMLVVGILGLLFCAIEWVPGMIIFGVFILLAAIAK